MSPRTLALLHIAAAVLSLLLGPLIFALQKGTRLHRRVGYGYVAAMLATSVTALIGRGGVPGRS